MPKGSGPRIDLCGTPLSTSLQVDSVPLTNKHSLSSSSQIVLEPVEAVLLVSVQLKLAQEKLWPMESNTLLKSYLTLNWISVNMLRLQLA